MANNNITSRGAGVHEALVNDPAKGGPHFPQRGDVPTPGDRLGRGPDYARYRLISSPHLESNLQNFLDATSWTLATSKCQSSVVSMQTAMSTL